MTTTAPEVRPLSAAGIANVAGVRFRADTEAHRLTILHDDGLYRHLRFKAEAGNFYWYDLITWPGTLTFHGDMGTYTFSRCKDMLEFFRSKKGWPVDDQHRINPGYWAEKTPNGGRGCEAYDLDTMTRNIWEHINDLLERAAWPDSVAQELREQVQTELIDELADHEDTDRALLDGFRFEHADEVPGILAAEPAYRYEFRDTWEWDTTAWTFHFLWACHAIVTGIEQYDAAKQAQATAEGEGS